MLLELALALALAFLGREGIESRESREGRGIRS